MGLTPSALRRIGSAVRKVERQLTRSHVRRSGARLRQVETWFGTVVMPEDTGDFPDHRYNARPLMFKPINEESSGAREAAILDQYPLDDDGNELYFDNVRVITNMSESLTRGHLLHLGQEILCHTVYDEFGVVRQLTYTPPPQPWMWVKIVDAIAITGRDNQWSYYGVRQVVDGDGYIDGTGFYQRTVAGIINPAEVNNNGLDIEGNSIDVSRPTQCGIVPIRGNPVVPIAPTYDAGTGKLHWRVLAYAANSLDRVVP